MANVTMSDIYDLARRLNAQSTELTGDPLTIPVPVGDNGEQGVKLYLWGMNPLDFLNLDDCAEWMTSQLI